jgi:hypothetical protein
MIQVGPSGVVVGTGGVVVSGASDASCCCDEVQPCDHCPDTTPARYTVGLTGLTACCFATGLLDEDGNPISVGLTGELNQSLCLWRGSTIEVDGVCWWFCTVSDPGISLTFYSDDGACGEADITSAAPADFIDAILKRYSDGSWLLSIGLYFSAALGSFVNFSAPFIFVGEGSTDNCGEEFVLTNSALDDDTTCNDDTGSGNTTMAYGGTATIAPSRSCVCESGELCPDPCLNCGDCPPYSETTTTLRLVLDGSQFGTCDNCDGIDSPGCIPATGDGCGCCIDFGGNIDCNECGPPPAPGPPPPAVPCICGSHNHSQSDCLANNGTWCCTGSGDDSTVSPCNFLPLDADVVLHITAHSATTQTFSGTIGGTTYIVVHTCATATHAASTFDVTILAGTGGRCRMRGIIGGGCGGGAGSVFTFDDTGLASDCGGGQGHATISLHWGCCS